MDCSDGFYSLLKQPARVLQDQLHPRHGNFQLIDVDSAEKTECSIGETNANTAFAASSEEERPGVFSHSLAAP